MAPCDTHTHMHTCTHTRAHVHTHTCTRAHTHTQVYLEPLRRPQVAGLTDPNLVRDIFYQIPEICSLHERFLAQVTQRVEYWHPLQKIGDIFVNTVSLFSHDDYNRDTLTLGKSTT